MFHPSSPPLQLGRPRDPRIDTAVLLAVVELLEDVGYQRLSIAAVATRAGTTKPAIYRRWPTKAQLVHEAVFPAEDQRLVPDSDDLMADLRSMVAASVELFSRPAVRAAVPGLLAEFSSNPQMHAELLQRFAAPVWSRMHDRIERAAASGLVRAGVDPDILLDVIGGSTVMALAIRPGRELDRHWVDQTVALIARGILT
jgi:AcrR family transcriptional regulator